MVSAPVEALLNAVVHRNLIEADEVVACIQAVRVRAIEENLLMEAQRIS